MNFINTLISYHENNHQQPHELNSDGLKNIFASQSVDHILEMYTSDENDANYASESDSMTSNNETSATTVSEKRSGLDNKDNEMFEEMNDNKPDIEANGSNTNNEPCKRDSDTEKEIEDLINLDEFYQMLKDVNNAETEMYTGINDISSSKEASMCNDCNNSATEDKRIEEPSLLLNSISGLVNCVNDDTNVTDIDSLSNNDVVMNVDYFSKPTNIMREAVSDEFIFNLDEFDKMFGMCIDDDKGRGGKNNDRTTDKKDDSKNELLTVDKDELALDLDEFNKVLDNFSDNDKRASDNAHSNNETDEKNDKPTAENKGNELTIILDTLDDMLNSSNANLRATNCNNESCKEVNITSNNSSGLCTMKVDVKVETLSNVFEGNDTAINTKQIESETKYFLCNNEKHTLKAKKLVNEQHVNLATVNLQNNNELTLNKHKTELFPKVQKLFFSVYEDFEETNDVFETGKTTTKKARNNNVISISSEESEIKNLSENTKDDFKSIDTISLSSTECKTEVEKQIDSDDGYRSSDFEFISENEAKKEGLINRITKKRKITKRSNKKNVVIAKDRATASSYSKELKVGPNSNLPGPSYVSNNSTFLKLNPDKKSLEDKYFNRPGPNNSRSKEHNFIQYKKNYTNKANKSQEPIIIDNNNIPGLINVKLNCNHLIKRNASSAEPMKSNNFNEKLNESCDEQLNTIQVSKPNTTKQPKQENVHLAGPSNRLDNDANRKSKFQNVNLPGPSNRLENVQWNYQYDNSYRENHVVPQGEEYLNLFRGIYMPWDLAFTENKSVVAPPRMNAEYNGIDFDDGMMRQEENSDDEELIIINEAKESAKKIRMMYPDVIRKRRRN